jgi:hypothetical protein
MGTNCVIWLFTSLDSVFSSVKGCCNNYFPCYYEYYIRICTQGGGVVHVVEHLPNKYKAPSSVQSEEMCTNQYINNVTDAIVPFLPRELSVGDTIP